MRLKRIRIFGFKSFADRVDIDVDGDFVAVVGSNGCGKSNIVDAIVWALGELSPKNLRAGQATDVIFSGSAKRKPLGYAEVSLVFDNEEGQLPVNTSEVVVTRRLSRDGKSEYFINRHPVRLRDIHELFADTGLGKTGYAIVSQSDIDAAVSAPPEERRIWIDEAAGVQRYRTRKVDALKRLESAVRHLERVTDVLNEIERQREPLRQQAEVAKRYKELVAMLREVESSVLIREADDLAKRIEELEQAMKLRRSQAEELHKTAETERAESNRLATELEAVEERLDEIRRRVQNAISEHERAVSAKAVLEQRLANLGRIEKDADALKAEYEERLRRLHGAVRDAERELEQERSAVAVLKETIEGSQALRQETEAKLQAAEQRLAEARKAEVERVRLQAEAAEAKRRIEALEQERGRLLESLQEAERQEQSAREAVAAATQEVENLLERHNELVGRRRAIEQEIDGHETERRTLLGQKAADEERERAMATAIENHETLPAGAAAVLNAAKRGELTGDVVAVGEIVSSNDEHARAIEAALGSSAGDLIVPTEREAETAIEWLKAQRAGRATFHPLSRVRAPRRPEVAAKEGLIGVAADLIRVPDAYRPVIEALLGTVLVFQDLRSALRAPFAPGVRKIVTLEGEVLYPSGGITGGAYRQDRAGPVRLRAQLEEVRRRLKATNLRLEELDDTIAEKVALLRSEEERAAETERALEEARQTLMAAEKRHASTAERVQSLSARISEIEDAVRDAESRLTAKPEVESAPVSELEQERNRLLEFASAAKADFEQARKALEAAEERARTAESRLQSVREELRQTIEAESSRSQKLQSLEAERQQLESEWKAAEESVHTLAKMKDELQSALEEAIEARKALAQAVNEASRRIEECKEQARQLEDAAYQDDIQRARLETKRAGVLSRLLEEYGIDEEDAQRQASLVEVPPDAEKLTRTLRREIRSLGDVNVGAIDAWEALTERYEVLVREKEDVLASKAELDASVAELDRLTRGAFKETFEKVRQAFQETFAWFFPGGHADLVLTDEENLLESGVHLEVVIPGKRRQRLELLSGGERALTACAFLFALLRVKPSPLVILDELDAPLDGRNVERYVEMLQEYSKFTQFIVITHNVTTIAAAPVWFGVTMQEPGVSTILPYKPKKELVASVN